MPGRAAEPGDGFQRVERAGISAGYLDTVRIPLLAGRDFALVLGGVGHGSDGGFSENSELGMSESSRRAETGKLIGI